MNMGTITSSERESHDCDPSHRTALPTSGFVPADETTNPPESHAGNAAGHIPFEQERIEAFRVLASVSIGKVGSARLEGQQRDMP
mmetsp:Transcript_21698/g.63820  ORF Transcript_21698/g.63820 Transcript_21698/m.63820 type:complete len:85 (-) Transcript_21698:3540-3794(-)